MAMGTRDMIVLIAGLILFLGIHSVRLVAPDWREAKIAAIGDGRWKSLYSLASIAGFVLMVWGFSIARTNSGDVYNPPEWGRSVAYIGMLLAFIVMFSFNLPMGYIKKTLKHPFMIGVAIWSIMHMLANGDAASVTLFGGMFVWSLWYLFAVSKRPLDSIPVKPARFVFFDLAAVVLGVALYGLFAWKLHFWLMGVSIMG